MRTLVQFLARIEIVLYIMAGLGVFFSIRALTQARQARHLAVYPLEREAAAFRQRSALGTILALILILSGIFILVNIVAPNMIDTTVVPTSTPIIFVTQQPSATPIQLLFATITPTKGLPPPANATTPANQPTSRCDLYGAKITSPAANDIVSGQVVVRGQANLNNFAQYKFEIKGPSTNDRWVVVNTFTSPVADGFLGTWDSTSLQPGSYVLRMMVSRNDGTSTTPCEVPITVAGPGGAAPPPAQP